MTVQVIGVRSHPDTTFVSLNTFLNFRSKHVFNAINFIHTSMVYWEILDYEKNIWPNYNWHCTTLWFPWNKGISRNLNATFWGKSVVWSRYNLTRNMELCSFVGTPTASSLLAKTLPANPGCTLTPCSPVCPSSNNTSREKTLQLSSILIG